MKHWKVLGNICMWARNIIGSLDFLKASRLAETQFIRRRKLPFEYLILYLLSNQKTSMQTGLNIFWEKMGWSELPCSRQAFSKKRQQVNPEGIRFLLRGIARVFYEKANYHKWNGHLLLAVDGSRYNLPETEETRNYYGVQITKADAQVQGLGSNLYDVLNGVIVDSSLNPCKSNERELLLEHLDIAEELHTIQEKVTIILDRGYPSAQVIDAFEKRGLYYVMRCSADFIRGMRWHGNDCIVSHKFTRSKITVKLRMLHIPLGNSEEILLTNIFDRKLGIEDFRELYHLRWNIETSYRTEKNFLEIENFSGATLVSIQQDYYATGFLYTLAQVIRFEMGEDFDKLHNHAENKLKYQQNLAQTIDALKENVVKMIYEPSFLRGVEMYRIRRNLLRATSAIQPWRSFQRRKKHKSVKFSKQYK